MSESLIGTLDLEVGSPHRPEFDLGVTEEALISAVQSILAKVLGSAEQIMGESGVGWQEGLCKLMEGESAVSGAIVASDEEFEFFI